MGTARLWDKDFNLLATFDTDAGPLYGTVDQDGKRWTGRVLFQADAT